MARWGDRWAREFESEEEAWSEYEDFDYDELEDFLEEESEGEDVDQD